MSVSFDAHGVLKMVDGNPWHLLHWCAACQQAHFVDGKKAEWDGHYKYPSFVKPIRHEQGGGICEYLILSGTQYFLESCGHPLKGKSAKLPEFPE